MTGGAAADWAPGDAARADTAPSETAPPDTAPPGGGRRSEPDTRLRIGDAERDAVATDLQGHFAAGRLSLEELNDRLDTVFAARTAADLRGSLVDLPPLDGRAHRGLPEVTVPRPPSDDGHTTADLWPIRRVPAARRRRFHGPPVLAVLAVLGMVHLLGAPHSPGHAVGEAVGRTVLVFFVGGLSFMVVRRLRRARRYRRPPGGPWTRPGPSTR